MREFFFRQPLGRRAPGEADGAGVPGIGNKFESLVVIYGVAELDIGSLKSLDFNRSLPAIPDDRQATRESDSKEESE